MNCIIGASPKSFVELFTNELRLREFNSAMRRFLSYYVSDMIFQNAAKNDPSLAAICRSNTSLPAPSS